MRIPGRQSRKKKLDIKALARAEFEMIGRLRIADPVKMTAYIHTVCSNKLIDSFQRLKAGQRNEAKKIAVQRVSALTLKFRLEKRQPVRADTIARFLQELTRELDLSKEIIRQKLGNAAVDNIAENKRGIQQILGELEPHMGSEIRLAKEHMQNIKAGEDLAVHLLKRILGKNFAKYEREMQQLNVYLGSL